MKNTQSTKPTKRKILAYYLILGASLLVIAAVTIGVVFAVKNNTTDDFIDDKPTQKPDDKPDDDNQHVDTSSQYEFIVPVKDVNLSQAHVFCHDVTLDRYCLHEGMDFTAKAGTQVFAAVDGKVAEVSVNDKLYGAVIKIEHADGVTTVYKFIDPVSTLKKGDTVNRGDVIATVATATGAENATGDHLHFEVFKNNEIVDPDLYLDITTK